MNENCLGTINCSPDGICGGNGAPCSSDEDCEQSCQAGRCVETQAGLDDTGNDGHGLDPEEEALLRDLETLTLLVTGNQPRCTGVLLSCSHSTASRFVCF